jgi:hypothetical protein
MKSVSIMIAIAAAVAASSPLAFSQTPEQPVNRAVDLENVVRSHRSPGSQFTVFEVPGSHDTRPVAVNDTGLIGGLYLRPGSSMRHGFLYDDGKFTLVDFSASYTNVYAVNNKGEFGGRYDTGTTAHGYVYSNGTLTTIDAPGSAGFTVVTGITDEGDLVGRFTSADGRTHGFARLGGAWSVIDYPGGIGIEAVAIDSKGGHIVGYWVDTARRLRGFTYEDGVYESFEVPGAQDTGSVAGAVGVNKHKEIVGVFTRPTDTKTSCGCAGHGFIRGNKGEWTTFDFPGSAVTFNTSINKHGDIVGLFYDRTGVGRGFFAPGGREGEEHDEGTTVKP